MTGQSNPNPKQQNTPTHVRSGIPPGTYNGRNDHDEHDGHPSNNNNTTSSRSDASIPASPIGVSSLLLPSIGILLRLTLGATIALYILNQKHLLPHSISKVVSQVLFWPTLPITISKRLGKWYTPIDETIIMGGAPFGFANIPELLYEQYDVRIVTKVRFLRVYKFLLTLLIAQFPNIASELRFVVL